MASMDPPWGLNTMLSSSLQLVSGERPAVFHFDGGAHLEAGNSNVTPHCQFHTACTNELQTQPISRVCPFVLFPTAYQLILQ